MLEKVERNVDLIGSDVLSPIIRTRKMPYKDQVEKMRALF